ncbi:hypothetical protein [Pedobacter mucosus]|uniref:hypothetical protein n=1 Tax=Pedobacter mucosus TaxID=2895286 RepID=UPI001EE41E4D|nr:hypothetical protein [Pedobacter mucosus]UKT64567.1 hypothetical protein LOK61_02035 [Pedobacter mucosus]
MKPTKYFSSLIVLLCLSVNAISQTTAQKIKVNGLLEEWSNLLNHKSTGSFYEFYNDQKNLYVALKFTDDAYIKKVIAGGLTLSINTNGKRNIKEAYQIKFSPIEDYRTTRQFTSSPTKIDSSTLAHRQQVLTKIKELQLINFTQIPDSIISIYNTYGIKLGAKADEKGNLNYELSIPLEQLKLSGDIKTEIAINIQFNAVDVNRRANTNNNRGGAGGMGGGGNRNGGGQGGGGNRNGGQGNNDLIYSAANDFWDKYKTQ